MHDRRHMHVAEVIGNRMHSQHWLIKNTPVLGYPWTRALTSYPGCTYLITTLFTSMTCRLSLSLLFCSHLCFPLVTYCIWRLQEQYIVNKTKWRMLTLCMALTLWLSYHQSMRNSLNTKITGLGGWFKEFLCLECISFLFIDHKSHVCCILSLWLRASF